MRTRTRQQERARYTGLSPQEFGDAVGVSTERVYQAIDDRWFGWTRDSYGRRVPECQDVRKLGGKRAEYRIHSNAVARWFEEHAVVAA